eukprot:6532102-Prymnesium_polylepis.1
MDSAQNWCLNSSQLSEATHTFMAQPSKPSKRWPLSTAHLVVVIGTDAEMRPSSLEHHSTDMAEICVHVSRRSPHIVDQHGRH